MVSSKLLLSLTLPAFFSPVLSIPSLHTQGKRATEPQVHQPIRTRQSQSNGTCAAPVDIPTTAKIPTPFQHFSDAEISAIVAWLSAPAQGLNLTNASSPDLKQTDNYVWLLEPLKPNKTDVLAYLDNGGPAPPSYAHVITVEGGRKDPFVGDYWVGPLPPSNATKMGFMDHVNNGKVGSRIPYNARPADGPVALVLDDVISATMAGIADITADLIDMVYYGVNDNRTNSTYLIANPQCDDGSYNYVWTSWRRTGFATHDTPSDLYISFDMSGSDPSLYKLRFILYNMVLYNSVDEFRDAWKNGKIQKSPPPGRDTDFLRKDRKGPVRDLEDRMAPVTISPDGRRYKLDNENKYIEYLGWSFYTRFDRDTGVQFYDIKFKGERIMYELSLQDAVAQYAGSNPGQAGTAFSDRFYGIGANAIRMIPGYDCPYHASYWNASFNDKTAALSIPAALCIFESDLGYPVTRHNDASYKQSTKASGLTVRMIATLGNYDYLFDYSFWVDGTIAVDARASGYVQGNYFRADEGGKWGPRINDTVSGSLHTHVMNFKADFDLIDTKNTFVVTDLIVENVTMPWYPERGSFESFRYNITELQSEDGGLLPLPPNGQAMYSVHNKAHRNAWGQPRGYRVIPGISNVHLASHASPFFLRNAQFAKQAFAVSRQHDAEPSSTSTLMQNLPLAPPVEFYKFFDGESLLQEDLVVWVNLGMHHYTRAEDVPNTLMTGAHSSVVFAPQDWGDGGEGTRDLQNAVIYNRNADGSEVVPQTNGVGPPVCLNLGESDGLAGVFEDQLVVLQGVVQRSG